MFSLWKSYKFSKRKWRPDFGCKVTSTLETITFYLVLDMYLIPTILSDFLGGARFCGRCLLYICACKKWVYDIGVTRLPEARVSPITNTYMALPRFESTVFGGACYAWYQTAEDGSGKCTPRQKWLYRGFRSWGRWAGMKAEQEENFRLSFSFCHYCLLTCSRVAPYLTIWDWVREAHGFAEVSSSVLLVPYLSCVRFLDIKGCASHLLPFFFFQF